MSIKDLLRDSIVGHHLNAITNGAILPYPEQKPEYVVPEKYLLAKTTSAGILDDKSTAITTPTAIRTPMTISSTIDSSAGDGALGIYNKNVDLERAVDKLSTQDLIKASPYIIVEWDEGDIHHPQNWENWRKITFASLIMLLTFSVYLGSAIYTPSIPGVMQRFNASLTSATAGLSLFVIGYGIGPMFLAPIQEMTRLGRNPVYIGGLFLYVVFQIPPLFAKNLATILVFRFFAGFFGSPALATGGASMGDVFAPQNLPYAIAIWAIGAVFGPVLGPTIGGFAAQVNGWKWPFYEMLWLGGFSLILLGLFLPESYEATLLHWRAERLRKLTGNQLLRTKLEIEAEGRSFFADIWHHFSIGVKLSLEPAVGFSNIYIGLIYACFYLWFEAFPLVFVEHYKFGLGISGLPFLAFLVTGFLTVGFYMWFNYVYFIPLQMANPNLPPEKRLELAIYASLWIPASLLIFGWTAKTHWIAPTIGAAIYLPGIFLNFQAILMYLAHSFPMHITPIFAANDLFRSCIAGAFPLFGHAYFKSLGLGGGSSLLAGISIVFIFLLWVLMRNGAKLRANSKWAGFPAA